MDLRTVQIGTATQIGVILIIVGLVCVINPYKIAYWHENDEDVERREFKRQQSHKKSADRREYSRDRNRAEKQPSNLAVIAVRVLGALALSVGIFMAVWSFN